MKFAIIVILSVFATALAQRPWYVNPVRYPELSPRFQNNNEDTNPRVSDVDLSPKGFPIGQDNGVSIQSPKSDRPILYLTDEQVDAVCSARKCKCNI
ncbi:hypothetical protein ILUMI_01149 [Ignelater luminosus]|uniref:Uncharacterized protein n=1 Tax=Ignelater luminosus TaxID=2038154 RepID=A0A8K0DIW8_IGNLU|nr:hypothetical protein ILUMI_01149 [Ignelater luminosus]